MVRLKLALRSSCSVSIMNSRNCFASCCTSFFQSPFRRPQKFRNVVGLMLETSPFHKLRMRLL